MTLAGFEPACFAMKGGRAANCTTRPRRLVALFRKERGCVFELWVGGPG